MQNSGKLFEQQFKKSVPEYCLLQRLNDSAQSFKKSGFARFTPNNPCDFFMFDSKSRTLYCIECKSTKYKSMGFEDINCEEEQNKMIHKHQILSLIKFSGYVGVVGCFLFNFRDENNNMERTYFQDIDNFNKMCGSINKSSFNEMDLILNGAIKIEGNRKRLYYIWDIDGLLNKLNGGK